jgi:murein DD-endopeptidase MepM/ murein hydrolase activator NlpD
MLIMLMRGFYHTFRLYHVRYKNPSVRKGKIRIIVTDKFPSFSFFRWVFIQKEPDNFDNPDSVLGHELAHASQFHSLDLVLFEIAQAILWFNPVIQLYRRSVLETHEFLADKAVLKSGTELRDYVDIIVEEIMHNKSYKLASHFKSSNLKKRVIMATKRSSKRAGFKYLLIIPVLVLGLISFSFSTPDMPQDKEKSNLPGIWPLEKSDIKEISNKYGGAGEGEHSGMDFAAKAGTPVVATASGIVKAAKEKGDYGNIVFLDHGGNIATLYAHLDKIEVKEGMKVKKGQVIGTVGNTGKSVAPHLHYEVRINGEPVNPEKVMMKAKQLANQKE